MKGLINKAGIACTAVLLTLATAIPFVVISSDVSAQEITSAITGTVLLPNGQPATGASAGPYTIRITAEGYEDLMITDLYTDVAGTSSFTVALETASADIEEITVTAAQIETITTASGPASTFTSQTINDMPSTQRQIRDILRIDPRVSVGETGDGGDQSGAISCAGGSSRTNSFTIDGVRATDNFGLNLSGNLARFTFPIPFDTVAGAAVEFAPVSVEYGQFSGCNINVVTKSGENEFHGGAFYLFNDDGMTNDKIDGEKFDQGTFERENYGVEFSGPIIKDKLFFYTAYEKFETATVNQFGAADDSSFPRSETSLTTAELNQIRDILRSDYDRDPGDVVRNLPVESERIFARFDWNINDDHRLEGAYTSLEETTTINDDMDGGTRGAFTFSDNFHLRGSDSETYAVRLYSLWTDKLSTEFRWSTQEVIDIQNPVGGGEQQDAVPKPRIAISAFGVASEFFGQDFASGPGTFRSANSLSTEKDQLKLKFDYQAGNHLITGGYEYETLDVFNLFIINATGTIFFNSVQDLADGNAYEIISANTFTGDPNDAAASYSRDVNSLFLQDRWQINDSVELIFGVRYDWYETDDLPLENPNYIERYGITNQVSYDGLDIIQPRIGLNYTLPESWGDTRLSLGVGVFSGNDPTVWFSNAYQNFGGTLGRATATGTAACAGLFNDDDLIPGFGNGAPSIPSCVLDAAQDQALNIAGTVNSTDPDFELPNVTRYSIGLEHNTSFESDFLSDWNLRADFIYSDLKDQVAFLDLSLQEVGSAPDGRPIYAQVNPQNDGCNATFNGPREGFSNVTDDCFGGATQDIFFTNQPGDGGHTLTFSLQANKMFTWGDSWSANVAGGYSYNESEIANPGTSFTAAENFRAVVAEDIVNLPLGPSLRNVPHNFVISTIISNEFWSGYKTSIGAFFQRRAGAEISPVFTGGFSGQIGDTGDRARNLVYIPTGEDDPLVDFGEDFDTSAFFAWADRNGLKRGQVQKKGGIDEAWASDLDIRIQQEIPFFGRAKGKIFLDIENFLNLMSSSGGSKKYINTTDIQSAVAVVDATIEDDNTYTYNSFETPVRLADAFDSLYRIQLGVRVDF
jgi:outer membrane receptor protein involved in Fe transport